MDTASMEAQAVVSLAIQAVFLSLRLSGLAFAFTGNVAQTIYGEAQHFPTEKVELSLLTPVDSIPELKQSLAQTYPAWFRYIHTSRRLWYYNGILAAQTGFRSDLEVVIVSSTGSTSHIHTINGMPIIPYSFILLRELMFWDGTSMEHLQSRSARETNIFHMLNTLRRRHDFVHDPEFDERMHAASVGRVERFFAVHPSFRKEWQRMGLMSHRPHQKATEAQANSAIAPVSHDKPLSDGPDTLISALESMIITIGPSRDPSSSASLPAQPSLTTEAAPMKERKAKFSRMQIRRLAARTTVEILESHGFPCALFGSMACKVYGNNRIPNDIDLLVLPPPDQTIDGVPPTQESLKKLLVSSAPTSFVLRPARDPEATYKVLYFIPTPTSKPTSHQASKVDILLPGVMSLPALGPSDVWWRPNGLSTGTRRNVNASESLGAEPEPKVPVLPFNVLLLQKLQAWDDHRRAEEVRYKEKAPVDVEDLEWMLGFAVPRYLKVDPRKSAMIWRNRELFDEEFENRSRERVVEFCEIFPVWRKVWRGLGFEVP